MLLRRLEFTPAEIEDDLHKRIVREVHDKMIKSFNMRESSRNGDQDLIMFMREVEEVVREIVGTYRFKGHQDYKYEAEFHDADRELLWGGRPVQALPSR